MFPKITTLERLTRNSSIEVTEKSNSFFIAEIYSVLKEENFTRGDNLWMLATDIFHLFNEITLNSGYLHEKDFDFQQYLVHAVSKINLRPLQYEATLISKMWEAFWCENLNPLEQVVDAAGAKMLRLRSLTKNFLGLFMRSVCLNLIKVSKTFSIILTKFSGLFLSNGWLDRWSYRK